ncbi:hypothetical protein OG705_29545 [Streptomyces sp. NBC_00838]|uniref:hypothetical protein n=1 Tax=Streptomyces sp. NBC_00838 TaxID=2903680 RepID=UPI003867943B|nr:hypothetical protein OG705_29545 [Streptomyces sp. NBC_00838]
MFDSRQQAQRCQARARHLLGEGPRRRPQALRGRRYQHFDPARAVDLLSTVDGL